MYNVVRKSTGGAWVLIINKGSADSVLSSSNSNKVQYSTQLYFIQRKVGELQYEEKSSSLEVIKSQ